MAPEVFHLQSLTFGADMWSLGGVALFMLSGHHPFNGFTSHNEQIHDIQTMNINVACETCISHLSADCHNLIFDCLLISNPRKRISSGQCLNHRWVYGETSTTTRRLRHMNTQQQMAYFMEKYPAHFTNESSHDDDEQTLV
jgi:serine/threonine protein kinase